MLLSEERQREILLSELKSLSETLHKRFFAHVTHWKPLDDPRGILSQIDNMTAGMLMRIEQLEAAVSWVSPLFVDENTPEDELRRRISYLNRDAERRL
jgi:hypothetical protein